MTGFTTGGISSYSVESSRRSAVRRWAGSQYWSLLVDCNRNQQVSIAPAGIGDSPDCKLGCLSLAGCPTAFRWQSVAHPSADCRPRSRFRSVGIRIDSMRSSPRSRLIRGSWRALLDLLRG